MIPQCHPLVVARNTETRQSIDHPKAFSQKRHKTRRKRQPRRNLHTQSSIPFIFEYTWQRGVTAIKPKNFFYVSNSLKVLYGGVERCTSKIVRFSWEWLVGYTNMFPRVTQYHSQRVLLRQRDVSPGGKGSGIRAAQATN